MMDYVCDVHPWIQSVIALRVIFCKFLMSNLKYYRQQDLGMKYILHVFGTFLVANDKLFLQHIFAPHSQNNLLCFSSLSVCLPISDYFNSSYWQHQDLLFLICCQKHALVQYYITVRSNTVPVCYASPSLSLSLPIVQNVISIISVR